jgi:Tol biopolymer transport system component
MKDCTVRCNAQDGCPSPLTCRASGLCAQASECSANDAAAEAPPDGTSTFPPCDPSQPFGTPTLVPGIYGGIGNDVCGRFSRDERTIYFASDRSGSAGAFALYAATRPMVTAAFDAPTLIGGELASVGENQCPTTTPDGLTMYFESSRTGNYQIWETTRDTLTSPWLRPRTLDTIDSGNQVGGPYVVPGGALYYHIRLSTQFKIYRADSLGSISNLSGPDSGIDDVRPVVTEDELTMYFASRRVDPGGSSQGGLDIWVATRKSVDDDFGAPSVVQDVNTGQDDEPDWISPDGCRLYLDRFTDSILSRIYVAQKPPL